MTAKFSFDSQSHVRASERILPLLSGVRSHGTDKWMARCPAHEDQTPSLSIKQESDRALLKCWAGCSTEDIVDAINIQLSDLFDENRRNADKSNESPLAEYSANGDSLDLAALPFETEEVNDASL